MRSARRSVDGIDGVDAGRWRRGRRVKKASQPPNSGESGPDRRRGSACNGQRGPPVRQPCTTPTPRCRPTPWVIRRVRPWGQRRTIRCSGASHGAAAGPRGVRRRGCRRAGRGRRGRLAPRPSGARARTISGSSSATSRSRQADFEGRPHGRALRGAFATGGRQLAGKCTRLLLSIRSLYASSTGSSASGLASPSRSARISFLLST